MRRSLLTGIALLAPCAAWAGDYPVDPKVNLNVHVVAADFSQGACGAYDNEGGDCSTSSHAAVDGQAFLFIVVSRVDGWATTPAGTELSALQFGIEYSGLDVQSWTLCTNDLEIPQDDDDGVWPDSGTGNAMTWPGCYDPGGENASVGILLVADGSGGSIQTTIDPREGAGFAVYVDCEAFTYEITGLRGANIGDPGSGPICNGPIPVEERSWGQIKSLF